MSAPLNPYEPSRCVADADTTPLRPSFFAPRRGPAIVIAVGSLLGLLAGVPLIVTFDFMPGLLGFIPGAILGGVVYRFASSSLPIDPTARSRRYRFAAFALISLPTLTAVLAGMQAQGFVMTIGALMIGGSFAIGILVSGDRRMEPKVPKTTAD